MLPLSWISSQRWEEHLTAFWTLLGPPQSPGWLIYYQWVSPVIAACTPPTPGSFCTTLGPPDPCPVEATTQHVLSLPTPGLPGTFWTLPLLQATPGTYTHHPRCHCLHCPHNLLPEHRARSDSWPRLWVPVCWRLHGVYLVSGLGGGGAGLNGALGAPVPWNLHVPPSPTPTVIV